MNWYTRQAQRHPARMIWCGYVPVIIVLVIHTYNAMRASLWMGLLMIPLLLISIALVFAIGKLVELAYRDRLGSSETMPE